MLALVRATGFEPAERGGGDRHADHRQGRERGEEAGERGGAAGACDEDTEPPPLRARGVLLRARRCAVRGGHDDLAPHLERVQDLHSLEHHLEVRIAAEHDAHPYGLLHADLLFPMSLR